MISFFVILEILLVLFRVSLPYLSQFVQLFEEWQTAMTWICVVVGVIAAVFVCVKIYTKIKGKKDND